jgi:TonB family protein
MQRSRAISFIGTLLMMFAAGNLCALDRSVSEDLPQARPAPLYNPVSRCPRVRMADEGTIAVVVFMVGSSGVPSQASIKTSSQSSELDAAALECVKKLRYLPTVRAGDGAAVDTWQQLGWRWVQPPAPPATAAATSAPQTTASAAVPATAPAAATGAGAAGAAAAGVAAGVAAGGSVAGAAASPSPAPAAEGPVEVRVCADETGRLTQDPTVVHSSGNPGLDQAAVRIAKSGAGNYRPASTVNGKPASGCARLSIRFE